MKNLISNIKKLFSLKLEKILLKKVSPFIGKILDRLFFTSFFRRGLNFYYHYDRNDYIIDNPKKICFIHLPKTGGKTIWNSLKKIDFPLYYFPKNALHNPVSLNNNPRDFRYITVMRNPLDRVYSQYRMFQKGNRDIAEHGYGLINTIKNRYSFKNYACQYYSGLIDEIVDERIFILAKENLKNFFFIIDFENIESDLKKLIKMMNLNDNIEITHINKSSYDKMSANEKEIIKVYNYWDLKLYDFYKEVLKKKGQ